MSHWPLLNHPKPYADETLASWLRRLAEQNYLPSPRSLLTHLCQKNPELSKSSQLPINRIPNETVLQGIADLSLTTLAEVYNHTFHRFATRLTHPRHQEQISRGVSNPSLVFGPSRGSPDLYATQISWCPYCLAEAQYVRWHWHIPLVVSCDVHRCWLVERCPECNAPISDADAIHAHCSHCNFQLTDAIPIELPEQDLLLRQQSMVMNWLYGSLDISSYQLPDVPVATLVSVLLGLRYAAQCSGNGWHYHHIPPGIPLVDLSITERRHLTQFERGCLYATAFRGLMNWPHGFFAYLDAYRKRPGLDQKETGLRREFGGLHYSWFEHGWKHPAFDFIQTAFNDYLVERIPAHQIAFSSRASEYPDLVNRLDYVSVTQAARYVESSVHILSRLIKEGHLTPHYFTPGGRMMLSRREIDQLPQWWENHLTIPQVAQMLGITIDVTRILITTPLIEVVPDGAGKKWQFIYVYRNSIVAFIQRLRKHTTILADKQQRGLSMTDVCFRNASIGLGFSEIWQRVCDGKLNAYHPNETLFPLNDMWFEPEAVANISQTVKAEHDWINLTDTLLCLGIRRQVLDHFLEAGLLQPIKAFGPKQFFRRSEVEALRDRAVSSRQAAEMLNTSLATMLDLNRQGRFSPLSGPGINCHTHYVFDRHELLAWREKYIIRSELMQLVSTAPIKLLKKHHIVPVFRNPNVYLRKEVMAAILAEKSQDGTRG